MPQHRRCTSPTSSRQHFGRHRHNGIRRTLLGGSSRTPGCSPTESSSVEPDTATVFESLVIPIVLLVTLDIVLGTLFRRSPGTARSMAASRWSRWSEP